MANPLIRVEDLQRHFQTADIVTKALDGVSLTIDEGEFITLMGPSGSGKSTLMHLLGFLDKPTGGQYIFRDQDVSALDDDQLALMRRADVGFVFQAFNLLQKATVVDNVMLPMLYSGVPVHERRVKAVKALEKVGLEHRINYASNSISGGEKQRVAIARALVNEPSVIFADEPTGNLDSKSGFEVLKLLVELNNAGNTIVMVTHEMEAAEFSKRIVNLRDGKLVADKANKERRTDSFAK